MKNKYNKKQLSYIHNSCYPHYQKCFSCNEYDSIYKSNCGSKVGIPVYGCYKCINIIKQITKLYCASY
jgi:hypothetical protein